MLKKIITAGVVATLAVTTITSQANLFFDDFESYTGQDPVDYSSTGNWVWNGLGDGSNDDRIFSTGNYGGSTLWIADASSAQAGTGINGLATIPVVSGMDYTFSGAIVTETFSPTRTASFTVDLLVGGASQIGGPLAGVARGDDEVGGEDT